MKIKVGKLRLLYGCLLFLSGCSQGREASQLTIELQQPTQERVKIDTSDEKEITNQEMKIFFQQYLTIDEDTMLILNQKPKEATPEYWEAYATYKTKTNHLLGDYLSEDAKKRLNKHYIQDDFHYPRLLEINEYMVTRIHNVDNATIISKQCYENNDRYHVEIRATAKVVVANEASQKYKWDEEKGYYVQNLNMGADADTDIGTDADIDADTDIDTDTGIDTNIDTNIDTDTGIDTNIDREPQEDMIKIALNYWVDVEHGERFLINSVKEKSIIPLGVQEQTSPKNNYFISRIPYYNEVEDKDKQKINKFLNTFMTQEYGYYAYYRKVYNTSYEMLKVALENDLGLYKTVNLKRENYQSAFNPTIIPLKDNMQSLVFNTEEDVIIIPHISSSKRHPVYEVTLQGEITLIDGGAISYEYIYLFSLENDMIYSVRFMKERKIQDRGRAEKHV